MKQFRQMMNHGFEVKMVMKCCFKEHEKIIRALNEGRTLSDILTMGQKDPYFFYIRILAKHIPLMNAIDCAERIESTESIARKDFLKQVGYPCFLLFFSYFLVEFFSRTIIPSMMVYAQDTSMMTMIKGMKVFYIILFFVSGIFVALFEIHLHTFIDIRWFNRIPMYKKIQTYTFSEIWKALMDFGLSTQQCVQIMNEIHFSKPITTLIRYTDQRLHQGYPIHEIFEGVLFDGSFGTFVRTGLMTGDLIGLLTIYQQYTRLGISRTVKQWVVAIQLVSYLSVALLVFVFYQVILMPLNLLNTF